MSLPPRVRACLLGLAVLGLFLLRPAAVSRLRAADPGALAASGMDGRPALLLPRLFVSRYHDEALYAGRVNQILRHGFPYSPYWKEDRHLEGWLHDAVSLYILAGFAAAAGGDLDAGWALAAAALAAAWFLLLRALLLWWTGRESFAAPAALFFVAFPDLFFWLLDVNLDPAVVLSRLRDSVLLAGAVPRPHFFRLPAPLLSYLLLALALCGAAALAGSERARPWRAALLGAGFGLLCLVHAYEFTFGLAALGLFAAAAALDRRLPASGRRGLWLALGTALSVSAAYVLFQALSLDPVARAESLEIMGLTATRRFIPTSLVHVLVGAFSWRLSRREDEPRRRAALLLLACCQGALFAARNAQLVTGFTVQPFHYLPLGGVCFGVLLLLLLGGLAARRGWGPRAGAAAFALIFAAAVANELSAARRLYPLLGLPADVEAGLSWLERNAPPDARLLSLSMEAHELAAVHTGALGQVPPASPPVSSVFTKERYYRKVAELLRSAGVDAPRFLAERWLTHGERGAAAEALLRGQEQGRPDRDRFEAAEWFYPFLHGETREQPVLEGRRRVAELAASVPPLEPPYYLWLDARDRRFLTRSPESRGGKLMFRRGAVSIYAFGE